LERFETYLAKNWKCTKYIFFQGQNCAGLERMIVQEGRTYDRLINDLTKVVGELRLGSPFDDEVDLGAITMKNQVKTQKTEVLFLYIFNIVSHSSIFTFNNLDQNRPRTSG
jgi:hypothetical protein